MDQEQAKAKGRSGAHAVEHYMSVLPTEQAGLGQRIRDPILPVGTSQ